MNKHLLTFVLLFVISIGYSQSVGIGTLTPHPSAKLEVSSVDRGFLPPRMTAAQRDSIINPVPGLMIWCTNCAVNGELNYYTDNGWMSIGQPSPASNPCNANLNLTINTESITFPSSAGTQDGSVTISLNSTDNCLFNIDRGPYISSILNASGLPSATFNNLGEGDHIISAKIEQSGCIVSSPLYLTAKAGNYLSNGYFYHPASPRDIVDEPKDLIPASSTKLICDMGDLGGAYTIILETDPLTNKVTISKDPNSAYPGVAGTTYVQFDDALPVSNPGYSPAWPNSSQCNNTYDPTTKTFKLRYGYQGGSGIRIIEEFIQKQ